MRIISFDACFAFRSRLLCVYATTVHVNVDMYMRDTAVDYNR